MKIIVTGANGFIGRRFMEYNRNRYELTPLSLRSLDQAGIDLQQLPLDASVVTLSVDRYRMIAVRPVN